MVDEEAMLNLNEKEKNPRNKKGLRKLIETSFFSLLEQMNMNFFTRKERAGKIQFHEK